VAGHPECGVLIGVSLLLVMIGFLFFRTQLGYSFFIYGNNPLFFENYGISARYVFCCGLLSAHALAGIGGYFVAQSSSFVDISAGFGMALFSVTCLILGKAFIRRRLFTILVPVVGTLAYCIIQQLLLKIGFNLKYFTMIQSLIVLSVLVRQYHKGTLRRFKIDNLGV
jgi:putative ABC transport system permease protein